METMTRKTLSVFYAHAIKYRSLFILIILGVIATTALDLYRPFILKYLFDVIELPGTRNVNLALYFVGFWVAVGIGRFILWRAIGYFNNYFQPRIISDLMNYCYEYILGHSHGFFTNNFSGSIQTRVRKFAYAFEAVADQVCFDLGRSILLLVMLLGTLLVYYWQIGVIVLIWTIFYFTFTWYFTQYKLKHDIAQANQDTVVTAHLADTLSNHSNINLFSAHEREVYSFADITDTLYTLRKKCWDIGWVSEIFQGIFMIGLEAISMYYIVKAWGAGTATVGDVVFVQAYLGRVFENTWNMGRNIRKVYEQFANANEMSEMLTQSHEIVDAENAEDLKVVNGTIQFENVTFKYGDNKPVFKNFNLTIPGGKKYALVGDSGGGKSTFVKALLRMIDVNDGEILIDDQNIAEITQKSLHEMVTLVPQDPSLFHRSLRENILYGNPNATEEDMIAAAKAAHCHEFITKLPLGYDTLVGERGIKLSGGERQRVAIARAILRNSPILILDEATSSLDSESESYIQDALKTLMSGKTVIVIAHRLSTIKEMDWIVVIESGKIAEQGTHLSLVEQGGKYSRHWDIQSGGFALEAAA